MQFTPMPEDEIKEILEGEEDVLLRKTKVGARTCLLCDGALQPMTTRSGSVILVCMACGQRMDPETGLITQLGNSYAGKELVVSMVQPSPNPPDRQPPDRKRHQT